MTTNCLPCEQMAAQDGAGPKTAVVTDDPGATAEWSGPIGIENQRTGDGRFIEPNALRWDTLPIPLRWAMQDFGAHDGAYVVGKIEAIERLSYEEANERLEATERDPLPESFKDAIIIWGSGTHDLGSEYGREAFRQVDEGLTPGISMDLDDIVIREEKEDDAFSIVEGRIRGATSVAIPAFEGARIATSKVAREVFDSEERLDDAMSLMGDDEAFNWVDDAGGLPLYIKRISKHLQKKGMTESHAIATAVNVVKKMCATGDVNFPGAQQVNAKSRAEACAAVADWERKKAQAKASAGESLVAGGAHVFEADWFNNPNLTRPTGLTVTDDGRVFGHIALWGTCHIANPQGKNVCTQPPRSFSNYAYFKTGAVKTTAGEIPVGKITMNTLHAGQRLSSVDTIHHYEHTGSVGAYVTAGEDQFGIWVAGAAHPDANVTSLKAAPVSGDWRTVAGHLEMVGALSVNVPGFPVPRATALVASGEVKSLVASGMVEVEERTQMSTIGEVVVNVAAEMSDEALLALRDRFREMDRAEAAASLAAKVNRLAALEKVRRVQRKFGLSFAYNPDQWRVPKGNGKLSGRFVDMPGVAIDNLGVKLNDLFDRIDVGEDRISAIGESLDNALDAGDRIKEAINAGDGDAAKAAAAEANESLSKMTAQIEDVIDNGGIEDVDAENIGNSLADAQESVDVILDSDLSLLGDEGIGGDAPETDIGGADEGVVGDAPEAPATTATVPSPGDSFDVTDGDAKDKMKALPAGSVVKSDDGEFITTYTKNDDGTWGISSTLEDIDGETLPADTEDEDWAMFDGGGGYEPGTVAVTVESVGGEGGGANEAPTDVTPDASEAPTDMVPGEGDWFKKQKGSAQQQAAKKTADTASRLEGVLIDAADAPDGIPEEDANAVGEALDNFRDALDRLTSGVEDGNYNASDLVAAQEALQQLEAVMMTVADKPGLSDANANQLGQALDDMFADLGALAGTLQGSTEPPPFATRKYVRQWLGRRGIRLGRTPVSF